MIIFEIIFLGFALIFALILNIFDSILTVMLWLGAFIFALLVDIIQGIVSFVRWDWKR